MSSLPLLLTVFSFILGAKAQQGSLTIITKPDQVFQCQSASISWMGGIAPYTVLLTDTSSQRSEYHSPISTLNYSWKVDIQAGHTVLFQIGDSSEQSVIVQTTEYVVQDSSDSSCLLTTTHNTTVPVGAIVGAVIGALAVIALAFLIFLVVCLRHRRAQKSSPAQVSPMMYQPQALDGQTSQVPLMAHGVTPNSPPLPAPVSPMRPPAGEQSVWGGGQTSQAPLMASGVAPNSPSLTIGMASPALSDTSAPSPPNTQGPNSLSGSSDQGWAAQRLQQVAYPQSSITSSYPNMPVSSQSEQQANLIRMKELQSQAVRNFTVVNQDDAPPRYDRKNDGGVMQT